jgi:hypothetical protein
MAMDANTDITKGRWKVKRLKNVCEGHRKEQKSDGVTITKSQKDKINPPVFTPYNFLLLTPLNTKYLVGRFHLILLRQRVTAIPLGIVNIPFRIY